MSEEFKQWLDALVRRHRREIFLAYSTHMVRWQQHWWNEKQRLLRERKGND